MFAPYCPTCRQRVLLGTRRIIGANLQSSAKQVLLRCFCGTLVHRDTSPPPEQRRRDEAAVA